MAKLLARLMGAIFLLVLSTAQGATPLLTEAEIAQLSTWLGNGPIRLERLYKKRDGQTAADFHAAVDGKGRTFTVMEATNELGQMRSRYCVGEFHPSEGPGHDLPIRNPGNHPFCPTIDCRLAKMGL